MCLRFVVRASSKFSQSSASRHPSISSFTQLKVLQADLELFFVPFLFHSFHGLMNSINWPASSVWVFIAQLGEHCSANAEATGSNPVEAPKIFFSGYFRNCLNCDSLRWSHTHSICIPAVQYHFIQGFIPFTG